MAVVQRSLVSDQIFRHLAADILSGRYQPGEKLPTQRDLATDLGVNMTSLREAVKRLEQIRLIEVRQGDAMRVLNWRENANLDVIAHLILRPGGLDRSTLGDVMEARRLMLEEAARLAAMRRSDEQAERLVEQASGFSEPMEADLRMAKDWAFFTEIIEAAQNIVFTLVMNSIKQVYFESAALFEPLVHDEGELASLYPEVADAVAARDGEGAAEASGRLALAQQRQFEQALEGS